MYVFVDYFKAKKYVFYKVQKKKKHSCKNKEHEGT